MTFGERLGVAFHSFGHLCVGIDPHPYLLEAWGLSDDASGLSAFSHRVVEASVGRVGIVKPQVAFFERHGSAGLAVLEEVMAEARASGLLVIADAKRGDVGTSVEAYGQAWLAPGSPLEADAVTVSPFLGFDSLAAVIELAESHGKGVFVLAATSNPESREVQTAIITHGPRSGLMVGAGIVTQVAEWNSGTAVLAKEPESRRIVPQQRDKPHIDAPPPRLMGSVGIVLGATVDFGTLGVDVDALGTSATATPILAPGFGHQGVELSALRSIYGGGADVAVAAASRSILSHGPHGLDAAIDAHNDLIAQGLR